MMIGMLLASPLGFNLRILRATGLVPRAATGVRSIGKVAGLAVRL